MIAFAVAVTASYGRDRADLGSANAAFRSMLRPIREPTLRAGVLH